MPGFSRDEVDGDRKRGAERIRDDAVRLGGFENPQMRRIMRVHLHSKMGADHSHRLTGEIDARLNSVDAYFLALPRRRIMEIVPQTSIQRGGEQLSAIAATPGGRSAINEQPVSVWQSPPPLPGIPEYLTTIFLDMAGAPSGHRLRLRARSSPLSIRFEGRAGRLSEEAHVTERLRGAVQDARQRGRYNPAGFTGKILMQNVF